MRSCFFSFIIVLFSFNHGLSHADDQADNGFSLKDLEELLQDIPALKEDFRGRDIFDVNPSDELDTSPLNSENNEKEENKQELVEEVLSEVPDAPVVEETLDSLFEKLKVAEKSDAQVLTKKIEQLWKRSGSDSIDLLLHRSLKEIHNTDIALSHISKAISLMPDFAEAWYQRSTLNILLGDYAQSFYDLYQVLRLEPRHYNALTDLGSLLAALEHYDQARDALLLAKQHNPHVAIPDIFMKMLDEKVLGETL